MTKLPSTPIDAPFIRLLGHVWNTSFPTLQGLFWLGLVHLPTALTSSTHPFIQISHLTRSPTSPTSPRRPPHTSLPPRPPHSHHPPSPTFSSPLSPPCPSHQLHPSHSLRPPQPLHTHIAHLAQPHPPRPPQLQLQILIEIDIQCSN